MTMKRNSRVRYELEYRPLSQRYIVRNLNSGDQDSFATLYSALNNLGRVQGLPVIDDALLEADQTLPCSVARDAQYTAVPGATSLVVLLARSVAVTKRMV